MKLLTLNIRHGGGKRDGALLSFIAAQDADVVVLTEYRNNGTGARLNAGLAALGYHHVCADAAPKMNTVLIAARTPIDVHRPEGNLSALHRHRVLLCEVAGVLVCGVYFPGQKVKELFWRDEFLSLVRPLSSRPSVLIGDFNTGQHFVDEVGRTFYGAEYLDALRSAGFDDAWRTLHPEAREYTWFSQIGNGFRVDHCWLSQSAKQRLIEARHLHDVRTARTSDHSALVVTLG